MLADAAAGATKGSDGVSFVHVDVGLVLPAYSDDLAEIANCSFLNKVIVTIANTIRNSNEKNRK